MEFIRVFTKLNKNDAGIAGGKGASLGEMTRAGIPVPPGFVVLSESFEQFLKETDLVQEIDAILHKVKHNEIHTVEAASEKIRELILNVEIPVDIAEEITRSFKELNTKYVAVRSSATAEDGMDHAWAGQLESYLNTEENDVLTKVKLCWSSLFTPRAIFYRFEKGLDTTKISVAVVVQKMVESEVSGIAFSVHPVTEDHNQLIIEAGFGLGEAIVSGAVTPDSYVVEKEPRKILDINISTQDRALYRSEKNSAEHGNNEWIDILEPKASSQVLNQIQILELSEIIIKIEKHYGFPCDIEWAFESGKFYIVQSRPITTLSGKNNAQIKTSKFLQEQELDNPEKWVEQGRWVQSPLSNIFFVLWNTTKVVKDIMPELDFHTIFIIDHYAFQYAKDRENIYQYLKKRYKDNSLQDLAQIIDKRSTEVFIELTNELKHDDAYIKKNIDKILKIYREFAGVWSVVAYIGDLPTRLAKEVDYVSSEAELFAQVHPHLRDTWIEKEVKDTVAIAKKFIKKYPKAESNSISTVISKDDELQQDVDQYIQEYVWSKINKWVGEPIDNNHVYKRIQEEIQNIKLGNHIETKHSKSDEHILDGILQVSISTAYWRAECGKMEMVTAHRLRNILKEIGKKNDIGYEQTLLLSPSELIKTVQDSEHRIDNKETVLNRQHEYFCTITKNGEEVILTNTDEDFASIKNIYIHRPVKTDHNGLLEGIGASPGFAKGPVRVVESPKDFELFKEGEILVADQTTPSFVPLMRMAAAIVTGKGGITSHAAIVSRELKKPCVIAVKDVNKILKNGDMIEVDATKGTIRILNADNNPKHEDFLRMFAGKSFVFIFSDIFLGYYGDLGVVSIQDADSWMSFFPKAVREKTQIEGRELYTSKDLYEKYSKEFHNYIQSSSKYFASILAKDQIRADDVEEFMKLCSKHFSYYSKTEFFYTDLIDQSKMVLTVQEFDKLKLDGRSYLNKIAFEDNGYVRSLIRKISSQTNVQESDLLKYGMAELVGLLRDNKKVDDQILIDRDLFFQSKVLTLIGDNSKKLAEEFLSNYREISSVIKGVTANKGKVKGRARVLLPDFKDFSKIAATVEEMQQGEVLVAETTAPEIIKACKKASAIITNQGGMLSHAAIISRELNIPCIVGTDKDVILNIKTGDMLEIDADNGIIKIIK